MKRCAKCDRLYADDYDGCPYCARGVPLGVDPGQWAPDSAAGQSQLATPSAFRPRSSKPNASAAAVLAAMALLLIEILAYVGGMPVIGQLVGLVIWVWVVGSIIWAYGDMSRIAAYQRSIADEDVVLRRRGGAIAIMILIWILGFPKYLSDRNKWLAMSPQDIRAANAQFGLGTAEDSPFVEE